MISRSRRRFLRVRQETLPLVLEPRSLKVAKSLVLEIVIAIGMEHLLVQQPDRGYKMPVLALAVSVLESARKNRPGVRRRLPSIALIIIETGVGVTQGENATSQVN